MKPNFKKVAALDEKNKAKVKSYWEPLWGNEYAEAVTEDYKPSGKTKKVKV